MTGAIRELVDNKGVSMDEHAHYAAILGINPSRGARSPALWNAAFQNLSLPATMVPFDVREENLAPLVQLLKDDPRFMGGAVTTPFKVQIMRYLDSVEQEAATAGAVNCLYKNAGKLHGTNTDGIAALGALRDGLGRDVRGARVLLLGLGGAGTAAAAYVAAALGKNGHLVLANRSQGVLASAGDRLAGNCRVDLASQWPISADLGRFDVVVNATSIGFEPARQDGDGWFMPKYFSPLGAVPSGLRLPSRDQAEKCYLSAAAVEIAANFVQSIRFLERQTGALVFDVIYQPSETVLTTLARLCGCRAINGLGMNLEQAVIAFDRTTEAAGFRASNRDQVRRSMECQ